MAPDIGARIDTDFIPNERAAVRAVLGWLEAELSRDRARILRCVLFLARGDLPRLQHNANAARSDWRDVIWWAEYERDDRRVRDFNQPFSNEQAVDPQ
jgi:hypothetical protein